MPTMTNKAFPIQNAFLGSKCSTMNGNGSINIALNKCVTLILKL